jgi:hypothetical protein
LTQLQTSTDEDACLRYVLRKLADKTALADSGLATEQDDRRSIQCCVEDLQKALQLNPGAR